MCARSDKSGAGTDGYRLLADGSKQAFLYEHGEDGRFTYLSRSVREVLGYRAEELIGRSWLELIHNVADRQAAESLTVRAWERSRESQSFSTDVVHKDGSLRTAEVTRVPLITETGTLLMQGIVRNVTAERRAADQLSLSSDILNNVDMLIAICNGKGEVIYVNPAVCKATGRETHELVGQGFWATVTTGQVKSDRLRFRMAAYARGQEPIPDEGEIHEMFDRSGQRHWFVWRHSKGPGDLLILAAQDITKVVATEEALRTSELRLRAMFDSSLDGMLLIDDNGNYVDANPAACAMSGLSRDELIGRCVGANCDDSVWESLVHNGSARGETSVRRPDGTKLQVEYSGRSDIQPGQHLLVFRDITERKKLEAQLRQSQKMEAVGRLAGGVAHDFNNMLVVIRCYSELLQKRVEGDAALSRYAECILNAADRSALITQQLLAFSRRQVIQPQVINVNTIVEDTTRLLRRVIGEDIRLELSLCPDVAKIKADPGQIGQIVLNLAVNARDAMPNGGSLLVASENVSLSAAEPLKDMGMPPGEFVVLRVTDSGCGMDKETQSHIFEPFFTTKAQGKGTGLGLATVYGIVKQSGGWIEVISAVNQGTTFNVYFPVFTTEPKQSAAPPCVPADATRATGPEKS